tara:strand:+ start:1529 stop:1639 length:111 start_codon:yes stop_codon:yes gene_type:complete
MSLKTLKESLRLQAIKQRLKAAFKRLKPTPEKNNAS